MSVGLFITGTGTGVGKTYVAALVARDLRAAGRRVGVYKPVASGCEMRGGELVSPDAIALWEQPGGPGRWNKFVRKCSRRRSRPIWRLVPKGRRVDRQLSACGIEFWRET